MEPLKYSGSESNIEPVYQWIDDRCSVVIVGIEGVYELSEDEIRALGGVGLLSHRVTQSTKSLCDPSVEFAAMVDDYWQVGLRLVVYEGMVFKWVYTEPTSPNSYLVMRLQHLDDFVVPCIESSKNVSVAQYEI
jgi:hypothetical protein